jgi:hypothetical protein
MKTSQKYLSMKRKEKVFRIIAMYLVLNMTFQYAAPTIAFALTSGPGQPEFSSFEPVGTSDMVDIYSGDFTYNIPLLSVPGPNGGYPINLAYHSGPGVDEEASWVGLGWNVNMGAINRQLRGLPDDFNGDEITQRSHIKPNTTVALNMNTKVFEFLGSPQSVTPSTGYPHPIWQIYYNNYKGLGYRVSVSTGLHNSTNTRSLGLGLSFDSQNGVGVEPDFSAGVHFGKLRFNVDGGIGYNSRQGLQGGSFAISGMAIKGGSKNNHVKLSSSISFGSQFNVPVVTMPTRTNTFPFSIGVNPVHGTDDPFGVSTTGFFKADGPTSYWSGFVSDSKVANDGITTSKAYGYLYNSSSASSSDMKDFQRENIPYSKKVPNLAPSTFSYDIFSQSGQGTGSQFRSYANAVGILNERETANEDFSYPINLEYGAGTLGFINNSHFGAGFTYDAGISQSGAWSSVGTNDDVEFRNNLSFGDATNPGYQASPFLVYGDKSGVLNGEDHLQAWGGDEAVKVKLRKLNDETWLKRQFSAENNFVKYESDNSGIVAGNAQRVKSSEPKRRATNMEVLTDVQAHDYGFTRNIGYTVSSGAYINNGKTFYGGTRSNHISEITTVQDDGMRYTYGLPAYNNNQFDGSFAVNAPTGNFNTKTVNIPHSTGSTEVDLSGTYDEYEQQTQIGPYVHSLLLSSVVSSDYVDLANDGPSDDDYGYWVRFNYDKSSSDYHWHIPYEGANYYEGKKGDPTDDRGSYSCGDREEYFLSSVETKTHIALFYLSKREDGVMAADDLNGGSPGSSPGDVQRLFKLDSIKLYTKTEFYSDIPTKTLRSNPVALKTAHFDYTYELCGKGTSSYYNQFTTNNTGALVSNLGASPTTGHPNINGNKGKLTLKKVWFTYQTSERGELSPYLFNYGNTTLGSDDNPYYDPTAVDRWGNYKKLDNYIGGSNLYPYTDNPYTDQRSTQSSNEQIPLAGVWSLKQITVPSGAVINVNYESDDYAYVENQPAMRMFDIYSLGSLPATYDDERQAVDPLTGFPYTEYAESLPEIATGQYRIYFRLETPQPYSASLAANSSFIQQYYLDNGNLHKLYFRAFMDLLNSGNLNQKEKDYVTAYADVDYTNNTATGDPPFGMAKSCSPCTDFDLGFITVKGEPIQLPVNPIPNLKVSPFIKAALQHLHFNRPELVHTAVPYSTTVAAQVSNLVSSISLQEQDIVQAMTGFNAYAYLKMYGREIDLNGRSQIRLYEPDEIKYGGGSRVRSITVNDSWDNDPTNTVSGVDPDNYSYGIEYDYSIEENGRTISSGVCYEPHIGGEESALRQPIEYVHSTPLLSNENLFLEKPLMESYYPGPSVGYRKVTVKSTAPYDADLDDDNNLNNSNILKNDAAPISIYEFYTPKEFPVVFDQTDINSDKAIVRPLMIPGIFSSFTKRQARSQGYSIVLNDMAGKLRSLTQRTRPTTNNPDGSIITKTEYNYYTDQPFSDNTENHLSSKVQVLLDDGSFQSASVGESHDIFIDMNENLQHSLAGGLDANLDVSNIPFAFISLFPQIQKKQLSMRTVVVNKIIYRTGIIKEVVATHEASTIKTESIAFDIETGEPLLTKTTNEFGDPVYQYTYPGHWFYAGLQGGYKNFGVVIDNLYSGGTLPSIVTDAGGYGRVTIGTNYFDGGVPADFFTPGDEVWIDFSSATDARYHVIKVGSNYIDLVSRNGHFIATGLSIESIRIIHSGHDNMQSVNVGALTLKNASSSSVPFPQYDPQNNATHFTTNTSYALSDIISSSAIEYSDIDQVHCVHTCSDDTEDPLDIIADPYAIGTRGLWRPYRSYVFETDRTQTDDIRTDGTYSGFSAFTWTDPASADAQWIKANTITKYSPHGFELENKDANGIYSAALFEYNRTLNTAVASNAKYKEIAYDGFEDYHPLMQSCDEFNDHWGYTASYSMLDNTQAHTGKYSLKIANGGSVTLTNPVGIDTCEAHNEALRLLAFDEPNDEATVEDTLDPCDCLGKFSPEPGKDYMVSVWVKQTGATSYNTLSTYDSPSLTISYVDGSGTHTLPAQVATGPIIEGWQRIYYTFSLSASTTSIGVTISNNSGTSSDDYFDDIRIQPFDASMMTYVYDPVTYRLVAQLDANNYATFFIYDEQGGLEKMKVETEDGIKTVKEGRANTKH